MGRRVKISQREAHRLRKRVSDLERIIYEQRQVWNRDFPDGVHIATLEGVDPPLQAQIDTARRLGYFLVATPAHGGSVLCFYAVKP